ncbi:nicotinamide-nucleotide amidohydrolase family protein [Aquabacter sp. L1I39]|uniref:CinA family protein n=1 Tax=Aquabacter sp. L1I39 TaxID=2820278 RepID=UPI001ADC28D3|nr:nicotinamide-nucleotide amidohydrolase family protein [Aquabacter sp. L1I39]QTL01607.1 nicotinamide-nucleotide amidohydrolase family protein [Aquabacter sp. L1I39]
MIDADIYAAAERVLTLCRAAGLTLATAESCTGGLVVGALTAVAGSSDVVDRGFVTYSNAAKMQMIGVPEATLAAFGAVSEETARAMAEGALAAAGVGVSVAITGVAGPGGGSPEKPVGLVHFASARKGGTTRHHEMRFGPLSRDEIRRRSVLVALDMLAEAAG